MGTSLVLSIAAVLLFAILWLTDCPTWFKTIGIPCDIFVWVAYLVVCPLLALLGMAFAARDVLRRERRSQAAAALLISAALLVWYWRKPPH